MIKVWRMSYKVRFEVEGYQCLRCGHKWVPRVKTDIEPTICPTCKSPYWNKLRKIDRSELQDSMQTTERLAKESKRLKREAKKKIAKV